MDIFIRNIPVAATNKHVENQFCRALESCGITHFNAEKLGEKPCAKITVLDVLAGQKFIRLYTPIPAGGAGLRMHWGGRLLGIGLARDAPSDLALKFLAENSRMAQPMTERVDQRNAPRNTTRFLGASLECGKFDYVRSQLAFMSHFQDSRHGVINIGRKESIIILGAAGSDQTRIDINYHDCEDVVLEGSSVIFNLRFAPKIYLIQGDNDDISNLMHNMNLGRKPRRAKKIRISAINSTHAKITGACWTYRFTLSSETDMLSVRNLLRNKGRMCPVHLLRTRWQVPETTFEADLIRLQHELTMTQRFGSKPFSLRYQLERLARNGYLPPQKVRLLLPRVSQLLDIHGLHPVLSAVRRLSRDIPFAGPLTESRDFSVGNLEETLETHCLLYNEEAPDNPYELAKRVADINLIHKVIVTPSGFRLEGPEPEPTNRVLRDYFDNTDYMIRVEFRDDGGAKVRFDGRTDHSRIYHERFKRVLDDNILICGFAFSFLGFSHSSLRNQSCWFMSPFFDKQKNLLIAELLLRRLGDFESIRTPAKCAARIGQSFTDTNASIDVKPEELYDLPIVMRNGRDFSDGVGTISQALLQQVWLRYGSKRLLKPTALQIRFQGAKGMVSLDSRLRGKALCLRSNMKKFSTQSTWKLEICGAAFKPLPMVLNRQFIKIFEDLGIPLEVFMDLQEKFKSKLSNMTLSAINTATFMEDTESSKATKLPALIRYIGQIGLDYHSDDFLYSVVEMSMISKLREVKYKGRIPVEQGVTLYGIMDETGFLKEREIYVVTEKAPEGGKTVLVRRDVVITRSPAMHPGDIQVVDAVDVPENSPLARLRNVVVFSQHGERDIPSMLSGGDLDGDLYNVIWHPDLVPRLRFTPANYPKVPPKELDRIVTRKDMSDFFVTFMETDQLGMICTAHMQVADQKVEGTLHPDCLRLAGMASTAVDFSKTGIAMTEQMPKYPRFRPDFMAPSPRVVISPKGFLDFEESDSEDDDAFEGIDMEQRRMQYYISEKALGHLFRNIDERQFVDKMRHRQYTYSPGRTLMERLLEYAQHWAHQYGIFYTHHKSLARSIRQSYDESLITILHNYEPTPHSPLSETEAFAGQIVGRQGGPQDKALKDLAKTMRERFDTVVEHAVMRITKGDEAMKEAEDLDDLYAEEAYERELEALPRALACLEVSVEESGYRDRKLGELRSFGYVALGVVLNELDRYRITTFGSRSGLPRGVGFGG